MTNCTPTDLRREQALEKPSQLGNHCLTLGMLLCGLWTFWGTLSTPASGWTDYLGKAANDGLWAATSWVTFLILKDLIGRLRGRPGPTMDPVIVEAGADGIHHIADGITGHIPWSEIISVRLRDGLYEIRTNTDGQLSRCVFAPGHLSDDEHQEVCRLFKLQSASRLT